MHCSAIFVCHRDVTMFQVSKGKKGGKATASAPQLAPSLLADVPAPAAAEDAEDAALQAEIALTTELLMQASALTVA